MDIEIDEHRLAFLRGVLAALASTGQVVHYDEIRHLCRLNQEQLGTYLGAARQPLVDAGQPDFNAIVVKEEGWPGDGFAKGHTEDRPGDLGEGAKTSTRILARANQRSRSSCSGRLVSYQSSKHWPSRAPRGGAFDPHRPTRAPYDAPAPITKTVSRTITDASAERSPGSTTAPCPPAAPPRDSAPSRNRRRRGATRPS
jgi:hypothetical protein